MSTELNIFQVNLNERQRASFRIWLQKQFTERCRRNSRYSLRAFAKALDMDPSTLSQILSGKRNVSKNIIKIICDRLSASPKEMSIFGLSSLQGDTDPDYFQVNMDTFSVISDWYHYAILELTFTSGFKSDAKWIAKKLSITVEEAKAAVERLKRLGLLLEENGSLIKSTRFLTNKAEVNTSAAHQQLQRQIVEKALVAIDEVSAEEKDVSSMTIAIDLSNLEKARELIRRFRREMCSLLEDGEQTQVYHLGIQLYPVSKK
jgi:transcriptional regulator with XRE-family HTH domain